MHTELFTEPAEKNRVRALSRKAEAYVANVKAVAQSKAYTAPESSLAIAGDTKYQNMVAKKIAHLTGVEHVVLIGIGGSSLATEALYEALERTTAKNLYVLDAIEPDTFDELEVFFEHIEDPKSVALVVITKSGTTTETLVNAAHTLDLGIARFGDAFLAQTVFVGTEGSEFMKLGKKKKVVCVPFPEVIGGRYSVFTAVGMVPLMLLGINTKALAQGAKSALNDELVVETVARSIAVVNAMEQGTHTLNFFTFNRELERLGFWYRQLLAESIGKPTTKKKKPFTGQLLPIVSTSVDLHSMAQLYLGGYRGMFTHFVFDGTHECAHSPKEHWLLAAAPHLTQHTPCAVKQAIRNGVLAAYRDASLAFATTELESITPTELGVFMGTAMLEVMLIAHLVDVNAFDQPQVELYKKHTHALLQN